jgi:hypothetical protein
MIGEKGADLTPGPSQRHRPDPRKRSSTRSPRRVKTGDRSAITGDAKSRDFAVGTHDYMPFEDGVSRYRFGDRT